MKKIYVFMLIFVLTFTITGCDSKSKENSDANNTPTEEKLNEITSIEDFEKEVKKMGISCKKTQMVAEYIGAQSGIKLECNNSALEIYKFSNSSDAYKAAEKEQKISMEGFGKFDAVVKNGYALMIDVNFPQHDKIIELFDKLK